MTGIELGVMQKVPKAEAITSRPDEEEERQESKFKFEVPTIPYESVIGLRRAKAILYREIEQPLKQKERYAAHEESRSTGILMYGPPGVGKTVLAQGIFQKLNMAMAYISGSSIMDKYVGSSGQHVKELFETAKAIQPSAIFIDEADVLLQSRDDMGDNSKEFELAISEFLVQISRVREDKSLHIAIIGATNLPWKIDSAHKRSGRFDYLLYVPAPDFWARRQLFKLYIKKENPRMPKEDYGTINYSLLAIATADYSPSDIKKVCHVATINAIGKARMFITTRTLQRALWSKEGGKSSLDSWFHLIRTKYLPRERGLLKAVILFWWKPKPQKEAKLEANELKDYGDLVRDVKRHFRWGFAIYLSRLLGKGLPSYW